MTYCNKSILHNRWMVQRLGPHKRPPSAQAGSSGCRLTVVNSSHSTHLARHRQNTDIRVHVVDRLTPDGLTPPDLQNVARYLPSNKKHFPVQVMLKFNS